MWENREWYEVAVYWPDSGETNRYGGVTVCGTLGEAKLEAEKLKRLNFKRVHIRRVKVTAIDVE